jgi:signal transduction histidine kinase
VKYSFPASVIQVNLRCENEWVLLSVQDQGQGIPASEIHRLFKVFSRAGSKSLTGEKSTGLGLAIVDRIVKGHHGNISVNSEVGKGSTFTVALPVAGDQERKK